MTTLRSRLLRTAAALPTGSGERRALLTLLRTAGTYKDYVKGLERGKKPMDPDCWEAQFGKGKGKKDDGGGDKKDKGDGGGKHYDSIMSKAEGLSDSALASLADDVEWAADTIGQGGPAHQRDQAKRGLAEAKKDGDKGGMAEQQKRLDKAEGALKKMGLPTDLSVAEASKLVDALTKVERSR